MTENAPTSPAPAAATGKPTDTADVIVVGAGPGGSAAAFHLARHGARVLL
ncbi:MAG TPA: FAD-dependent oxidoreductase, partial [Pilimelia sp.]|nr:FAD-dependent oxidoreductase [Pilimelia sp.]